MAVREPRRSPRFRCLLLDLLEDDLLRFVLGQFEVRFDGGVSGRENGLQSEEAECCRQLSLTCRRISVALCFSSSARSLTEIPRSLAAVDDVLSRSMVLLGEAAKLQAALRALPPEVYQEPAENTRAALQVALLPTSTLLPTTHNTQTHPPHALRSPPTALQSGCTLHAPGDAAHARRHAGLSGSLPDSDSPTLSHVLALCTIRQATLQKRGAMLASARSRHAEDTKWLRKFEAQWARQDRPDAQELLQELPGADSQRGCTMACTRASSRTSRRRQEERQAWGVKQAVGGFPFVRRVHLLTANYVRNGCARTALSISTRCTMTRLCTCYCSLGSLPRAYYALDTIM